MSDQNATDALEALQNIVDEDDEVDSLAEAARSSIEDNYHVMLNVARSAGLDLSGGAPGKDTLLSQLVEAEVFRGPVGDDEYYQGFDEDEVEHIERLEVQTGDSTSGPSEPTDATVLYCLTRAETTPERVQAIADALDEHTDFEVREAGSEPGDKYAIVLPAENQEQPEPEEGDEADGEQEAESAEESDSEAEADGDEGESEESDDDEESAADDDDEEEDEESVSADVVRERLEAKNKSEVYAVANDLDISGRSEMTKEELIDAVIEEKDGVEAAAA